MSDVPTTGNAPASQWPSLRLVRNAWLTNKLTHTFLHNLHHRVIAVAKMLLREKDISQQGLRIRHLGRFGPGFISEGCYSSMDELC